MKITQGKIKFLLFSVIILTILALYRIYVDKKKITENYFNIEHFNDALTQKVNKHDQQLLAQAGVITTHDSSIDNLGDGDVKLNQRIDNLQKKTDKLESKTSVLEEQLEEQLYPDSEERNLDQIKYSQELLKDSSQNFNSAKAKWSKDFYDYNKLMEKKYAENKETLDQIVRERKELNKLVNESKETISKQTDKFSEGVRSLGNFHNTYQKELSNILKRKYNLAQDSYDIRKRIQDSRLKNLQDKFKSLDKIRTELVGDDSNKSQSIKCLGTGDRFNVEPLTFKGNPTNKHLVYLNNGCMHFNKDTDYDIRGCQASDKTQQFSIHQIDNHMQYNEVIDAINDGSKKLVFESDDIIYPFKIVTPLENRGQCLTINDDTQEGEGGVSIEPCRDFANQRFRTSVLSSSRNCKQILGTPPPTNNNPN